MYRGFNLSVSESCFEDFREKGALRHRAQKARIGSAIESFNDEEGNLVASHLMEDWFPQIDCEVFISHARKDSDMAIGLAGFLEHEFGINAFIDSCVWGYADSLLEALDKKYCFQESRGTYDYNKRNKSTSHVHMMLSTALAKMIDKCECVIFLNTPQSISSGSFINGSTTDSPWLYAEIVMTNLMRRRCPRVYEEVAKSMTRADEELNVRYSVSLDHLVPIGIEHLQAWQTQARGRNVSEALNVLYRVAPM